MKTLVVLAAGLLLPTIFPAGESERRTSDGFELYEHIALTSSTGMEAAMSAPKDAFSTFDEHFDLMWDDEELEPEPEPEYLTGSYTVIVLGQNLCTGVETIEPTINCFENFTTGGTLCDGTSSPGCGEATAVPACGGAFTSGNNCTSHDLCTSRWCTGHQACTFQSNCTNGLCTTGTRCTVGRDCTRGPSCTNGDNCTLGSACTAFKCTNGAGCTLGNNCTKGGNCTKGTNCTTGDCTRNIACTKGPNCNQITHGGPACTSGDYCTSKFNATCPSPSEPIGGGSLLAGLFDSTSSLLLLGFVALGSMIAGIRPR